MNQVLCEMCGLHNRPEAETCARCKEPLEVKTRITTSPFLEAASRTTQKTVVAHTEELLPPRRSTQEATRVVAGPLEVPEEARQEPQFAPRGRAKPAPAAPPVPVPEGLPAIRSRIPTQPLTGDSLRPQPGRSPRAAPSDLQQTTPVGPRPTRPTTPAPPEHLGLTAEYTSPAELPRTVLMELDVPSRDQPAPAAAKSPLRDRLAAAAGAVAPTTVGTPPQAPHPHVQLTRASWHHHLAANAIDAVVALLLVFIIACVHVALGRHGYPNSRPTAFENLGLWLARSGSQPWRTALTAVVVLTAYGAWGALRGATLGRMVMGLVLVSQEGRPVSLGGALWHGLGCGLNMLTLGAGTLWFVVDRWHRSWASLLSRTQVVPRHQVVPR